jgi:hypothetical protein
MKNLLLILSLGALVAGCSKDGPQDGETARVPITLRVGEAPGFELSTRSPLEGWYNTSVWMAYGESASAANTSFIGFGRVLDGFVANNMTTFRPLLFYPANGETIYLRGVYPREGITNLGANGEITGDRIEYTITGQEDIMVSNTLSGSLDTPIPDDALLRYRHLLTRLSFTVRSTGVFPSTLRLTFIRVLNVSRNAVLELDPVAYPAYDTPDILTFTDAPTSTLTAYGDETGRQVTTGISEEFANVMFRPGEAFDVQIGFNTGDVLTIPAIMTTGSDPRDISLPGGTLMGMKYKVNVTLSMEGFTPAISAAWVEVQTGTDRDNWW